MIKPEVFEQLIEKWRAKSVPPRTEDGSDNPAVAERRGRDTGERLGYKKCADDLESLIKLLSP